MNNDELQKAIDDITSGGAGAPVTSTPVNDGATDENEQLANEFGVAAPTMTAAEQVAAELGEAPAAAPVETFAAPETPVVPEEPAMPAELVAPVKPEPVTPEMPAEPVVPEESVIPEPEPVAEPEVPEIPEEPKVEEPEMVGTTDLEEVKKNALKELYPLLKNMNINPEQAYDICKQVAEMGEKGAIAEAFEAAKKISDDTARANALFEIVEMIEK